MPFVIHNALTHNLQRKRCYRIALQSLLQLWWQSVGFMHCFRLIEKMLQQKRWSVYLLMSIICMQRGGTGEILHLKRAMHYRGSCLQHWMHLENESVITHIYAKRVFENE